MSAVLHKIHIFVTVLLLFKTATYRHSDCNNLHPYWGQGNEYNSPLQYGTMENNDSILSAFTWWFYLYTYFYVCKVLLITSWVAP